MHTRTARLAEKIKNLPLSPGCYLFKGENGTVLYVGKSKCLRHRVRSYFQKNDDRPLKLQKLARMAVDIDHQCVETEIEALLLEYRLIKQYKPVFNVMHKREVVPRYIEIDMSKPLPGLRIIYHPSYPTPNFEPNTVHRIGPFHSMEDACGALTTINSVWHTPLCNQACFDARETIPHTPCFNGHLGKCVMPCSYASENDHGDAEMGYRASISKIIDFFHGNDAILHSLKQDMHACADNLQFERAALLRDRYNGLDALYRKLGKKNAQYSNRHLCVFVKGYHEEAFILIYMEDGVPFLQTRFMSWGDWRDENIKMFASSLVNGRKDNNLHPRICHAVFEVQAQRRFIDISGMNEVDAVVHRLKTEFDLFHEGR